MIDIETAIASRNYDALSFMVSEGAKISGEHLATAINEGDLELVHFLIVNDIFCDNAIELALALKNPAILRNVLASQQADVNQRIGKSDRTALQIAAGSGDEKLVTVILNARDVDINAEDNEGKQQNPWQQKTVTIILHLLLKSSKRSQKMNMT